MSIYISSPLFLTQKKKKKKLILFHLEVFFVVAWDFCVAVCASCALFAYCTISQAAPSFLPCYFRFVHRHILLPLLYTVLCQNIFPHPLTLSFSVVHNVRGLFKQEFIIMYLISGIKK